MINPIHYPDTNSVEVTWLDADGKQTRCHSYADMQMDMLTADLGAAAAEHADLIATVTAGIQPYTPPPPVIPTSLSMKQARLALLAAGYLDAVEAGVSAMPRESQIAWEFAATVDRGDPLTDTLASALGLNAAALDALFTAGAAL